MSSTESRMGTSSIQPLISKLVEENKEITKAMDGKGIRKDEGKPRFDLLPPRPLVEVAKVFTQGATKYKDRNWEKGMRWGKHYAALQRHLQTYWGGEDMDPESGCHHLAHVVFGCLALIEYASTCPALDDRPTTQSNVGCDDALLATTPASFEELKEVLVDE